MRALFFLLLAVPLFGSNASPVNISTVTRSSNVVTVVTSTAHGITTSTPGVCLTGVTDSSFNGCFTAASVTNSTTFTFNQTAGNASSSGGTTTAGKQIIFTGYSVSGTNQVNVTYLLWNYTGTGLSNSSATSRWSGASAAEVQAIKNGTTIETQRTAQFAITASQGQIDQFAQNDWLGLQNAIVGTFQPGQNFGCYCDPVGCGC